MNVAYNADCLAAMREMPDNAFDLAVVDPPYGDGCSQSLNVERERESRTPKYNRFGGKFDKYKQPEQAAHGRLNSAKKSSRGMLPRKKNTSTSFFASHAIKSFGAAITSPYRRLGAF